MDKRRIFVILVNDTGGISLGDYQNKIELNLSAEKSKGSSLSQTT